MLIFFKSRHYSFFEKLKIVEKQLCKLNSSDGKVSHTLKIDFFPRRASLIILIFILQYLWS